MKKFFLYALTAVFSVSCMTSCSDDDDPVVPGEKLEAKTYAVNEGLGLTLDNQPLVGKVVTFKPGNNNTATITLAGETLDLSKIMEGLGTKAENQGLPIPTCGVIPGSPEVSIPVTLEGSGDECKFSGDFDTQYCTFKYSGEVKADSLALNISDLKLKNTNLVGTWNLIKDPDGNVPSTHVTWEATDSVKIVLEYEVGGQTVSTVMPLPISSVVGMALAMPMIDNPFGGEEKMCVNDILPQILKSVEFCEDGNIVAKYIDMENDAHPELVSPKGIAQYVVNSDSTLNLFLNPQMIIANTLANASRTRAFDIQMVESLMSNLLPLLKNGIPMGYAPVSYKDFWTEETVTLENSYSFTIGKEVLMPILNVAGTMLSDPETIEQIMQAASADESMKDMAPMLKGVLESFPNVIKTTSEIKLGLNMERK